MLPRVPRRQRTPQPPALNAVGGRVFQRKIRACARASGSGARGAPGPHPGGILVLRAWEVRMDAGRSWTHMASGTRCVTGPVPRGGNGSGAVGPVR